MDRILDDVGCFVKDLQQPSHSTYLLYRTLIEEESQELQEAHKLYLEKLSLFNTYLATYKSFFAAKRWHLPTSPEQCYAMYRNQAVPWHKHQQELYTVAYEVLKAKTQVFDGILDTIWVLVGQGLMAELPMMAGWLELATNNLSKLQYDAQGNLRRRADGKLLKPDNFQPPNFLDLILSKATTEYVDSLLPKMAAQFPDK